MAERLAKAVKSCEASERSTEELRQALSDNPAVFDIDYWVAWLCRRQFGGQRFALIMLTEWHRCADKDLARLQTAMVDLQRENPSSDRAFMNSRLVTR